MTDEARIARLTELARRVWPGEVADNIPAVQQEAGHWVEVYGRRVSVLMSVRSSSRALDALEAALLVLADEERTERRVLEDRIAALERDRATLLRRYQEEQAKVAILDDAFRTASAEAQAAEAKLARLEQLASEWERDAPKFTGPQDVRDVAEYALQECARELRACVKEEP